VVPALPAAAQSPWTNPRVLVVLLLVFLSGAVVGALTHSMQVKPVAEASFRPDAFANASGTLAKDLTRELDLSSEQQAQLQRVLDDFFLYYHELQDQMDQVRATGRLKILEILTPEQKEKFEEWQRQHHP
jgi:Spy/CpxP family protein refolding chaperone